jgi:hypothetical protein
MSFTAEPQVSEDPCLPSPCGRFSECTDNQGTARCACLQGYFGTPPNCRPECLLSSDCPPQLACIGQKCSDPCVGICGSNALCKVVNHRAICSCPPEYTGDPFVSCNKQAGRIHMTANKLGFANRSEPKSRVFNFKLGQGNLSEGEGSARLTSSLR